MQKTTTKIGDFDLDTQVLELSADQEYRYVIEVLANEDTRVGQYFPTHELRKASPADFPNDFYFATSGIGSRRTLFRNLYGLTITKKLDVTRLCIQINFEHWDWHLPENLHHFAERLVQTLKKSSDAQIEASFERDDVGLTFLASVIAPSNQDLYSTFLQLASDTLKAYRSTLAQGYNVPPESSSPPSAEIKTPLPSLSDTHGTRWWIRYVVVPVVGSGTFAVVIGGMLKLLK